MKAYQYSGQGFHMRESRAVSRELDFKALEKAKAMEAANAARLVSRRHLGVTYTTTSAEKLEQLIELAAGN